MKLYIKANQVRWSKEIELERHNTTPKAFWKLISDTMQKHGEDISDWLDYETWVEPNSVSKYKETPYDDFREAFRYEPYNYQEYRSNSFNIICEFEFDTKNKGYGYFYFAMK